MNTRSTKTRSSPSTSQAGTTSSVPGPALPTQASNVAAVPPGTSSVAGSIVVATPQGVSSGQPEPTIAAASKQSRSGSAKGSVVAVSTTSSTPAAVAATRQRVGSSIAPIEAASQEVRSGRKPADIAAVPKKTSSVPAAVAAASKGVRSSKPPMIAVTSGEVRSGQGSLADTSSKESSTVSTSSLNSSAQAEPATPGSETVEDIFRDLGMYVNPSDASDDDTQSQSGSRESDHGSPTLGAQMTWEEVLLQDSLVIGHPAGVVVSSLKPLVDALDQDQFESLFSEVRDSATIKKLLGGLRSVQAEVASQTLRSVIPRLPPFFDETSLSDHHDTLVMVWRDARLAAIPAHFWKSVGALPFRRSLNREGVAHPIVRLSDVLRLVIQRGYASTTYTAGLVALSLMPVAIIGDMCDAISVAAPEALEILLGTKDVSQKADKAASMVRLLLAEQASPTRIPSGSVNLAEAREFLASIIPLKRGLPILSSMTTALNASYEKSGQSLNLPQFGREREAIRGRYPFDSIPTKEEDFAPRQQHSDLHRAYTALIRDQFLQSCLDKDIAFSALSAERGSEMAQTLNATTFVQGLIIASAVHTSSSAYADRLHRVWPALTDMDYKNGLFGGPVSMDRAECARILALPQAGGSAEPYKDMDGIRQDRRFYGFFIALMRAEYGQRRTPLSYGMDRFVSWVSKGAVPPQPRDRQSSPLATTRVRDSGHRDEFSLGPAAVAATLKGVSSGTVAATPKKARSGSSVVATSREVRSGSSAAAASKEVRSGSPVAATLKGARSESGRDRGTRVSTPPARRHVDRASPRRPSRRSRSRSRPNSRSRSRGQSYRRSGRGRSRSRSREHRRRRSASTRRSLSRDRESRRSRSQGRRSACRSPPRSRRSHGRRSPSERRHVGEHLRSESRASSLPPPSAAPEPAPTPVEPPVTQQASPPLVSLATPRAPSDQLALLLATVQDMSKRITSLEKPSRKRKMEESIEVEAVRTRRSPASRSPSERRHSDDHPRSEGRALSLPSLSAAPSAPSPARPLSPPVARQVSTLPVPSVTPPSDQFSVLLGEVQELSKRVTDLQETSRRRIGDLGNRRKTRRLPTRAQRERRAQKFNVQVSLAP